METLEELKIKLINLEIRYENGSIDEDLYLLKKSKLLEKISQHDDKTDIYWVYTLEDEPDDDEDND